MINSLKIIVNSSRTEASDNNVRVHAQAQKFLDVLSLDILYRNIQPLESFNIQTSNNISILGI